MIMLKEPIAREANIEDGVSGHFFGERFWCRRCWTVEETTQAMMFAHTNPVRAGLAQTPETAEYLSYRDRLEAQRAEEPELGKDVSGGVDEPRTAIEMESLGLVEVPGPRNAREDARRRADFLAPLRLEVGGSLHNREIGPVGGHEGESVEGNWKRWRESIPAELPVALERLGLDRVRWAESYRRNARRFDRLTRRSDALRRDFQQRL